MTPLRKKLERAVLIAALIAAPVLAYFALFFHPLPVLRAWKSSVGPTVRWLSRTRKGIFRREMAPLPPTDALEARDAQLHLQWDGWQNRVPKLVAAVEPRDKEAAPELADYRLELIPAETLPVLLRWTPIPLSGVSYSIEVSPDPQFRQKTWRKKSTAAEIKLPQLTGGTTYYWRVSAQQGIDALSSDTRRFTLPVPRRTASTPAKPQNKPKAKSGRSGR